MSKKQSFEQHQISIAREELELKKALIERMDKADREFNENMEKMSSTMEAVGNAIKQSTNACTFMECLPFRLMKSDAFSQGLLMYI